MIDSQQATARGESRMYGASVQQLPGLDREVADLPPIQAITECHREGDILFAQFKSQFEVIPANTAARIRTAQQIRYKVYCIEHRHEPSNNPDGLEIDEFDYHAVQSLLVYRVVNAALGTVRLILPLANDLDRSFPVQCVLAKDELAAFNRIPLQSTAEISRFSVSRQLRRDASNPEKNPGDGLVAAPSALIMRLGLMQGLIRMSALHGMTHWCAAIEPTFQRMLAAMGIHFQPLGPLVEYHGLRQPCFGRIEDVLSGVKRERPMFWSILTDRGALWDYFSTPKTKAGFEPALAC